MMQVSISARALGGAAFLLIVAWGYFATLVGGQAAFHGLPALLLIPAIPMGALAVSSLKGAKNLLDGLDERSRARVVQLQSIGTSWLMSSPLVFGVEIMLPSLTFRAIGGLLALCILLVGVGLNVAAVVTFQRARPRD